jgi:hypothetical protein
VNAPGPACLSDLRLDMLLAHDLDAGAEQTARAHLAGCAACAARLAAFEGARAALAGQEAAGLQAIRRVAEGRPSRTSKTTAIWRSGGWLGALGVVVATVGVWALLVPPALRGDRGTRIKGGARVGFFVDHAGSVRAGEPGERLAPGDVVRFTYSTAAPAHLAILGLDTAGQTSVYFPPPGASDEVAAGRDVALPRATELDETLGPETVVAIFCEAPIDLPAASRALRAGPGAPVQGGCVADRLSWIKERAP